MDADRAGSWIRQDLSFQANYNYSFLVMWSFAFVSTEHAQSLSTRSTIDRPKLTSAAQY